jgi:hypothetical protein
MGRSAASIARRHAYTAAWRAARPGYGAMWAKAHPGTERARRLRWKRANREKVQAQRRRRALALRRPVEPLPVPFTGHPIFDQARALVGPDPKGFMTYLADPLHEDLLSVAVVAIIEGSDPLAAVRRFRAAETGWRRVAGPLLDEWGIAA